MHELWSQYSYRKWQQLHKDIGALVYADDEARVFRRGQHHHDGNFIGGYRSGCNISLAKEFPGRGLLTT